MTYDEELDAARVPRFERGALAEPLTRGVTRGPNVLPGAGRACELLHV